MESFGSWSVLTANFLIILFMALGGITLASILHLVNGQWRYDVRYLSCSLAALFPIAFVLLLILLGRGESTFPWLAHVQGGEHHLPGWHNYIFLVARQVLGFLVVVFLYVYFIRLQYQSTIDDSYKNRRLFRNVALLIPFAYVLYGTMVAWDFEMTMMPGWHSASYGAYHFVSNFHGFLAFFAIFLFFLNRSGKLRKDIPRYVFNYLAQMLLAFTILWTYFYFTQYIIIWYGRLPEEMDRYVLMMTNKLGSIWWVFLTLKFLIPFLIFALSTKSRHKPSVIVMISIGILVGTWLERYTWVSATVDVASLHLPMTAVFDVVVTVALLIVSWFAVRWSLMRYGLLKV